MVGLGVDIPIEDAKKKVKIRRAEDRQNTKREFGREARQAESCCIRCKLEQSINNQIHWQASNLLAHISNHNLPHLFWPVTPELELAGILRSWVAVPHVRFPPWWTGWCFITKQCWLLLSCMYFIFHCSRALQPLTLVLSAHFHPTIIVLSNSCRPFSLELSLSCWCTAA